MTGHIYSHLIFHKTMKNLILFAQIVLFYGCTIACFISAAFGIDGYCTMVALTKNYNYNVALNDPSLICGLVFFGCGIGAYYIGCELIEKRKELLNLYCYE